MRIFLTIALIAAPLASCKKERVYTAEQTPDRGRHEATHSGGGARAFPTSLPGCDGSVTTLEDTLAEVRRENTLLDADGVSETLHLDEPSFRKIVSAFTQASRAQPDRALRTLENEPGELRAAVVSRHLSNLVREGTGTGSTADRDAFDYVESIEDDDERRGAIWLLVKELLKSKNHTEIEVADAIRGFDGISRTTANHMVATTANRIRTELSPQ